MLSRFERFNTVGKEMVVIHKVDVESDSTRRRKITNEQAVVLDSECGAPDVEGFQVFNNNDAESLYQGSSSRVGGEEEISAKIYLESEIVPKDITNKLRKNLERNWRQCL
jgi:hypothetical protein